MPDRRAPGETVAPVVATVRFDVPPPAADGFAAAGERVLAALAAQRGFRAARVCRAVDEPAAWLLVTEWDGPGAWRRALSAFDVRCELTPLLGWALDVPGAFEVLHERAADGPARSYGSALAPDAAVAAPGTPYAAPGMPYAAPGTPPGSAGAPGERPASRGEPPAVPGEPPAASGGGAASR